MTALKMTNCVSSFQKVFNFGGYQWNILSMQVERMSICDVYTYNIEIAVDLEKYKCANIKHLKNVVKVYDNLMEYVKRNNSVHQSYGVLINHKTLLTPIVLPLKKLMYFDKNDLKIALDYYAFDYNKVLTKDNVKLEVTVCRFF